MHGLAGFVPGCTPGWARGAPAVAGLRAGAFGVFRARAFNHRQVNHLVKVLSLKLRMNFGLWGALPARTSSRFVAVRDAPCARGQPPVSRQPRVTHRWDAPIGEKAHIHSKDSGL